MTSNTAAPVRRSIELESKPDFDQAMARLAAWFAHEIVDRAPVRFSRHNAEYELVDEVNAWRWPNLKARWYDEEYQLERFLGQIAGKTFHGETFPVFWPNVGPNVLAGCYGAPLEFGEVTSWAEPILDDYDRPLVLDWDSEYLQKLDSLTRLALERCPGKFLVGYTDIHPGLDWLAALRGSQQLCLDLFDRPADVKAALRVITPDFLRFYDHCAAPLAAAGQPSVSWMAIPALGRMHIPSCDFAALISPRHFREFALPLLAEEVQAMTHNIYHLDGKGAIRHLDAILELPNVQAIQWVQGVADDQPILQWIPLIRRIQAAGKSVVVDLVPAELDEFMAAVRPEGILLCLPSEGEEEELALLAKVAKWR